MALSRRVRIGLIGYGTWAQRVHIPSIELSQSAVLTAVCGPDAARARQIAATSGAELATAPVSYTHLTLPTICSV